jgi:hypothetical protein
LQITASEGVSREVKAMSAFEILDALGRGQTEKTQCPICLGFLGESSHDGLDQGGYVAMTKCGHMYCFQCFLNYAEQTHGHLTCPSCRKQLHSDDILEVNPSKTSARESLLERRQAAKQVVKAAAHLLETSNGQLAPHMWEQLFLSVDIPEGVDDSVEGRLIAIPREVAAHIRAATRMPLHCRQQIGSKRDEVLYSSKVQALLNDLPRDERSVVFSSSRACIKHLQVVLDIEGVGCRALFSGQSAQDSERAVSEWKCNFIDVHGERFPQPVLLVQSGAAASGLTLTAACKVFLMEPFVRYEEEQQAYARCHRYGQEKPVHVKCYFAPVSVESRLLEWRKVAESASRSKPVNLLESSSPRVVYSSIQNDEEHQDRKLADDENDDSNQTHFLLGLANTNH